MVYPRRLLPIEGPPLRPNSGRNLPPCWVSTIDSPQHFTPKRTDKPSERTRRSKPTYAATSTTTKTIGYRDNHKHKTPTTARSMNPLEPHPSWQTTGRNQLATTRSDQVRYQKPRSTPLIYKESTSNSRTNSTSYAPECTTTQTSDEARHQHSK